MAVKFQLAAVAAQLQIAWDRYLVDDALGRRIVCYFSASSTAEKLPLVLYIQGSDCGSLFVRRGNKIVGGYQNLLLAAINGRARVLVVEKPGVQFLDESEHPGTAEEASFEYLREHTLPRWLQALRAAVKGAQDLDCIDPTRILILGHSEGGQVAAHLAPLASVSHVACLAGSDFRFREMGIPTSEMLSHPEGLCLHDGHTFRYWTWWLHRPMLEPLLASRARLYLAHGMVDGCSSIATFDRLVEALADAGRTDVAVDVSWTDHGFNLSRDVAPAGMEQIFKRVLQWFLAA